MTRAFQSSPILGEKNHKEFKKKIHLFPLKKKQKKPSSYFSNIMSTRFDQSFPVQPVSESSRGYPERDIVRTDEQTEILMSNFGYFMPIYATTTYILKWSNLLFGKILTRLDFAWKPLASGQLLEKQMLSTQYIFLFKLFFLLQEL